MKDKEGFKKKKGKVGNLQVRQQDKLMRFEKEKTKTMQKQIVGERSMARTAGR